MKKRLVTIALSAVMMFGLVGAAAPAQAHFQSGGNCHILRVSANGTITFRITNRLNDWAQIYCGLRFNDGETGTTAPTFGRVIRSSGAGTTAGPGRP